MRKAFHMPHVFREIFTLGIPGSVSNLLMSAVNTITNRIVIAYGPILSPKWARAAKRA